MFLLSSLPQALFCEENGHPGLYTPCCCYFFRENGHSRFDKPCCCYPACRRSFFSDEMAKTLLLRLNIGSGSACACSALAQDPEPFKARGQRTPLMPQKSQLCLLWQCHRVQVADRQSGPKSTKMTRHSSRMVARS